MHGLKMHLGRYEELDFFDIMGDDLNNPNVDKEGPHGRMERLYGLSKWAVDGNKKYIIKIVLILDECIEVLFV